MTSSGPECQLAKQQTAHIFRAPFPFTLMIIGILTMVEVLVCLLLILIVLMQRPRQEGLGASFGDSMTSQVWGAQTTNVLQKFTVYLAVLPFRPDPDPRRAHRPRAGAREVRTSSVTSPPRRHPCSDRTGHPRPDLRDPSPRRCDHTYSGSCRRPESRREEGRRAQSRRPESACRHPLPSRRRPPRPRNRPSEAPKPAAAPAPAVTPAPAPPAAAPATPAQPK
jgi:preprotein translocase subunit SecG